MSDDDVIELPRGGGLLVSGQAFGQQVPLDGWADGYRLTFLWLLDLYARAMAADQIDDAGNIRAIVLIDELDQHLHPALQAAILPHLTELLPNAQFVATTHSPLMALGAQPSDLRSTCGQGARGAYARRAARANRARQEHARTTAAIHNR